MRSNSNRTVYAGRTEVQLHPTEEGIARSAWQSYRYAKDILKGPFPAGEQVMSHNPFYAFEYAKTIKGRFIAGEMAIANSEFADGYIKKFDKTGELGLKAIFDGHKTSREANRANRPVRTNRYTGRNYYQLAGRSSRPPVYDLNSPASPIILTVEPTPPYTVNNFWKQKKKKPVKKDWQKYGF